MPLCPKRPYFLSFRYTGENGSDLDSQTTWLLERSGEQTAELKTPKIKESNPNQVGRSETGTVGVVRVG